MKEPGVSLRNELAEGLEAEAPQGPHPGADELIAYHAGELGEKDAGSLQEHLASCRECLDHLLDLEAFVAAGHKPRGGVADLGAEATLRSLRGKARRSWPVREALAAALLVLAMGLGWWGAEQRALVRELRESAAGMAEPQVNALIFDLSATPVRGPAGEQPTLELPDGSGSVTLILHLGEDPGTESLAVELEDPGGRTVWRGRSEVSEFGTLSLWLPRSFLEEGTYRLLVFAEAGGERRQARVFLLNVALASGKS